MPIHCSICHKLFTAGDWHNCNAPASLQEGGDRQNRKERVAAMFELVRQSEAGDISEDAAIEGIKLLMFPPPGN